MAADLMGSSSARRRHPERRFSQCSGGLHEGGADGRGGRGAGASRSACFRRRSTTASRSPSRRAQRALGHRPAAAGRGRRRRGAARGRWRVGEKAVRRRRGPAARGTRRRVAFEPVKIGVFVDMERGHSCRSSRDDLELDDAIERGRVGPGPVDGVGRRRGRRRVRSGSDPTRLRSIASSRARIVGSSQSASNCPRSMSTSTPILTGSNGSPCGHDPASRRVHDDRLHRLLADRATALVPRLAVAARSLLLRPWCRSGRCTRLARSARSRGRSAPETCVPRRAGPRSSLVAIAPPAEATYIALNRRSGHWVERLASPP